MARPSTALESACRACASLATTDGDQHRYSTDLEAGTVTFTNVSGYSQPVTIEAPHRGHGRGADVQISGEISFTRALTHEFPLGSHVSSAPVASDLFALCESGVRPVDVERRVVDALSGSSATATFNNTQYPIA